MNKNEVVRQELINYVKRTGVKYVFIANKLGISKAYLSLYIHNKRDLNDARLDMLKELIRS